MGGARATPIECWYEGHCTSPSLRNSHLAQPLLLTQPPLDEWRDAVRVVVCQRGCRLRYLRQQILITQQIGNAQLPGAGLAGAEHLTGAAQFEVGAGDDKTI